MFKLGDRVTGTGIFARGAFKNKTGVVTKVAQGYTLAGEYGQHLTVEGLPYGTGIFFEKELVLAEGASSPA